MSDYLNPFITFLFSKTRFLGGVILLLLLVTNQTFAVDFKITPKVLEELDQAKLAPSLQEKLNPLVNQLYTSDADLLAALRAISPPPTPEELALIVKYARVNNLLIRADSMDVNRKTGTGLLEGNVYVEQFRDDIKLEASRVQILSENSERFNKFIADTNVHIQQLENDVTADHAVYNRTTQLIQFTGNIVLKNLQLTLSGDSGFLDRNQGITEIKGREGGGETSRAKLLFVVEEQGIEAPLSEQKPSTLQAQRIHFTRAKNQGTFEGQIELYRPQRELFLTAGKAILDFTEDQELSKIYAEQGVCIEQPGRIVRADRAYFDEASQEIRLEGNAQVGGEASHLRGNTLRMWLDVEKGEARGEDDNTQLEMTINLDGQNLQIVKPCR